MRYLSTALLSEGISDDQFLPNLLVRALTELCEAEFIDQVEVADVQPLRDRPGPSTVDEAIAMVERNDGAFSAVFYHRDQGANPDRVQKEWLDPLRKRWADRGEQLVAVVPVRETEASVGDYLGQLGDYVDLGRLQQVPAYRRWWADTRQALVALGYRPIDERNPGGH
ncbi:hypothetical protein [Micromonospora sp. LOL_023]|uniref:hypothetical protein n=1 Tax=Micromonospora sp. LOL_023 TaxID=3345418 RepID=UPI003A885564